MALNAGIAKNTDANDARSGIAATNDVLLLNADVILNANEKLQRKRSR